MEDLLQEMKRSACIPKATDFSGSEYDQEIFKGSRPASAFDFNCPSSKQVYLHPSRGPCKLWSCWASNTPRTNWQLSSLYMQLWEVKAEAAHGQQGSTRGCCSPFPILTQGCSPFLELAHLWASGTSHFGKNTLENQFFLLLKWRNPGTKCFQKVIWSKDCSPWHTWGVQDHSQRQACTLQGKYTSIIIFHKKKMEASNNPEVTGI